MGIKLYKIPIDRVEDIVKNEIQIDLLIKKINNAKLTKKELTQWIGDCLYFKNNCDVKKCEIDIKFRKVISRL